MSILLFFSHHSPMPLILLQKNLFSLHHSLIEGACSQLYQSEMPQQHPDRSSRGCRTLRKRIKRLIYRETP
ncbi:hypothetical protein FGO68_gene16053 [Halteria grandinella]|uniref:Uncharacterized protein n=1 Tax=Halteria grandinella TaxID=5974 RepID=A0A8J8T7G0_HALGN|nr:hypothetical protein FGO68_gene16053 [Halteria grandinella]